MSQPAGLDPEAARVVRDFIKELRAEGRTIFLTTHNLPEADELCDLIGVFRTQLLRLGTPAQLRAGMFGSGTQVQCRRRRSALARDRSYPVLCSGCDGLREYPLRQSRASR